MLTFDQHLREYLVFALEILTFGQHLKNVTLMLAAGLASIQNSFLFSTKIRQK